MQVEYAVQPRLSQRLNWRLFLLIGIVACVFGYPLYVFLDQVATGGIESHGSYSSVDLKALGNFPFDDHNGVITDVPAKFCSLDGKRIELKGFMYPTFEAGNKVHECQFVYNITRCCFSGPPLVQERVFLFGSKNSPQIRLYSYDVLVRIVGTLHLRITKNPEGKIIRLYDLDVESAEPV